MPFEWKCLLGKPAPNPMPVPEAVPGCPPGLEYLTQIDQLLVNQQVELLECKFTCHSNLLTCTCLEENQCIVYI